MRKAVLKQEIKATVTHRPGEQLGYNNEQQRIIEVATQLIEERGLASFRIDALSERLGYSRQNIYRYFANKRAILDAVVVAGSVAMAETVAERLADLDAPFDELLIEGILIACDLIHGGQQLRTPYSGKNLPFSANLFLDNAEAVQRALHVYLEPTYRLAKQRGEMYLSMSFEDITKWLFQVVVGEIAMAQYETREQRRAFLQKMFSPSINAKKAQSSATIDSVHSSHLR